VTSDDIDRLPPAPCERCGSVKRFTRRSVGGVVRCRFERVVSSRALPEF
jgi:hypothetical protein